MTSNVSLSANEMNFSQHSQWKEGNCLSLQKFTEHVAETKYAVNGGFCSHCLSEKFIYISDIADSMQSLSETMFLFLALIHI